jgi:molecular chaperone GrpE
MVRPLHPETRPTIYHTGPRPDRHARPFFPYDVTMRQHDNFEDDDLPVQTDGNVSGDGASDAALPADSADQTAIGSRDSRELAEQKDKYLRLAAEYDNYRKRSARERSEAEARGQANLIKQLLDPLDDLSRFAHVDASMVDPVTITQGADMVERKLHKVLTSVGLEVIDPIGKPFDPAVHEAVSTEPAESVAEDHMVGKVFQVGYRHHGQLLRPARVVVKQWNG